MTAEEQQSGMSQAMLASDASGSELGSNLSTYKPTPYQSVTWPVVSSASKEESFSVLDYERISERQYVVDPMFANFDQEEELRSARLKEQQRASRSLSDSRQIGGTGAPDSLLSDFVSSETSGVESGLDDALEPSPQIEVSEGDVSHDFEHVSDDSTEHSASSQQASGSRRETPRAPQETADVDELVEREVQKRLSAAQEEREQMLAQVQQAAYSKALEDARAEFEDLKKQYSTRFETIVEDTRFQVDETCRGSEQQAVDLAFQIAKKLVGAVVTDHRAYIHEVISEALRAAGNAEIKSVRVSPQDYEFLSTPQGNDASSVTDRAWKLESDDSIGAGCIVVTSAGDVDFDLEKSWARMREKVTRGPKS